MNFLGNLIWLIFGGFLIALEYLVASVILIVTVIGVPFGVQTLKLAYLALWPFGKRIHVNIDSSGCLFIFMNILWLLCGGIWIALTHLLLGILLIITIVGIPWARQHFKLASIALSPFGKEVVSKL